MAVEEEPLDSATDWVAQHTRRYVETNGQEGHEWRGVQTLVLTTTGRKSGKQRRNALIYGRDSENYLVVASKGGAAKHPLWYLNLQADPNVNVQVEAQKFAARARTASAEEKPRLWAKMTEIWPAYNDYQAKTERNIPIVVLQPVR
ncbi:MAG TPA: nitroreductase family deazaflavin-dependent oxidoreductase [Chloroflexota bacterium]|nr:nitroreductase family deazaflavin-dependent oxidoreductase [Chloroflexota bacterium]